LSIATTLRRRGAGDNRRRGGAGTACCPWDGEAVGHGPYCVGGDTTTTITDDNSPAADAAVGCGWGA